jgi:hypothetical protein
MILGTAMVGNAAARFVITAKNIDREELRPGTDRLPQVDVKGLGFNAFFKGRSRIDIAFAGLLVLMACALFLLTHALVTNALTDLRNRFEVFF